MSKANGTAQEIPSLRKKEQVHGTNPIEYRTFHLNRELAGGVKIKSLKFVTDDPSNLAAPIYLNITFEVPTEQVQPYRPDQMPNPGDLRSFPIFANPTNADLTPTEGATVHAAGVPGTTATNLTLVMDSGGKVPGGVGAQWRLVQQ